MEIVSTDRTTKGEKAEGKDKIAGEKYLKIWGTQKRDYPEIIEVTAKEQHDAFGGNLWDYSFDFRWVRSDGKQIRVWTPQVGNGC